MYDEHRVKRATVVTHNCEENAGQEGHLQVVKDEALALADKVGRAVVVLGNIRANECYVKLQRINRGVYRKWARSSVDIKVLFSSIFLAIFIPPAK